MHLLAYYVRTPSRRPSVPATLTITSGWQLLLTVKHESDRLPLSGLSQGQPEGETTRKERPGSLSSYTRPHLQLQSLRPDLFVPHRHSWPSACLQSTWTIHFINIRSRSQAKRDVTEWQSNSLYWCIIFWRHIFSFIFLSSVNTFIRSNRQHLRIFKVIRLYNKTRDGSYIWEHLSSIRDGS